MKHLFFIILLIGCQSKEFKPKEFKPLVNPLSGITVAQGNGFLVREVTNSVNETSYMIFYDRNIETEIVELNRSRLRINGKQGSVLHLEKFDESMLIDLESIR